jgi:hypothetical protein
MKFRTEIDIAPWGHPITYDNNIVTLGSCFANAIAERLCDNKFKVTASPTGILFNPESIALMVELMSSNYIIKDEDIIERDFLRQNKLINIFVRIFAVCFGKFFDEGFCVCFFRG